MIRTSLNSDVSLKGSMSRMMTCSDLSPGDFVRLLKAALLLLLSVTGTLAQSVPASRQTTLLYSLVRLAAPQNPFSVPAIGVATDSLVEVGIETGSASAGCYGPPSSVPADPIALLAGEPPQGRVFFPARHLPGPFAFKLRPFGIPVGGSIGPPPCIGDVVYNLTRWTLESETSSLSAPVSTPWLPPFNAQVYCGGQLDCSGTVNYVAPIYLRITTTVDVVPSQCREGPKIKFNPPGKLVQPSQGFVTVGGRVKSKSPMGTVLVFFDSRNVGGNLTLLSVTPGENGCDDHLYSWSATLPNEGKKVRLRAVAVNSYGAGEAKSLLIGGELPSLEPDPEACDPCDGHLKQVVNPRGVTLSFDPPDITVGGSTPLVFSRHYNSDGAFDGPLGRGWTHTYAIQAIRILDPATGKRSRLVRWPDGRRLQFKDNDDGTFTGPPGWFMNGTTTAEGRLVLSTPDRTQLTFRADGLIESIQDRKFQVARPPTISFSYDDRRRLTSVSTDINTSLAFTYNARGKIANITASTGQTASFTYVEREATNLLTEVVGPTRLVTKYDYDDNDYLIRHRDDEDRDVLSATHDERGRLKSVKSEGFDLSLSVDESTGDTVLTYKDDYSRTVNSSDLGNLRYGDSRGRTTSVERNDQRQVTKSTDEMGRVSRFAYSPSGRMTSVTAADGTTTTVDYATIAGVERPTVLHLPSRKMVRVDYDSVTGSPTKLTDPAGKETLLESDDAGRVKKVKDPSGRTTNVTYDPNTGLATEVTLRDPTQSVVASTQIEYDPVSRHPTSITAPLNRKTEFVTDLRGAVTEVKDAEDGITKFEYDSAMNPTKVIDARGHESLASWDEANRPTETTNAAGQKSIFEYTARGDLKLVRNFRGEKLEREYDERRLCKLSIDAGDNPTEFEYDTAGQLWKVTDPRRKVTEFTRDLRGRLRRITPPGANAGTVEMDYHPDGQLKSVIDEELRATVYGIDANGRTNSISVAGTTPTTMLHDTEGRLLKVTDPLRRVTEYTYDPLGRLASVIAPDRTAYKMVYDVAGRLTEIDKTQPGDEARPRRWLFGHDKLDRVIRKEDPLHRVTNLRYDAVGNLTQIDEPGENTSRLITRFPDYDKLNRPRRVERPDGETIDVVYNDDKDGEGLHSRTLTITRAGETTLITRHYDALERLVRERIDGNVTEYGYDANSNVTRVSIGTPATALTQVLAYTYDDRNRPISITDSRASRAVALDWDRAGQLTQIRYPSGIKKSFRYGPRGEIERLDYRTSAGSLIRQLDYFYDAALQLTRREDLREGSAARVTTYGYNLRGELTSVNYLFDGTGERFTHDDYGNIIEYDKVNGATVTSELRFHDEADQLYNISGARQLSLTYDPRGNISSISQDGITRTFTWDSVGRLSSITGNTTLTATYADDYRLTLFKDGESPAVQPVWGMDNMLAEITTGGAGEQFTLHLPELDSPIERGPPNNAAERQTLLTDHLMSAIAAYDDAGEVIPGSETEYLAYGGVKSGDASRPIGFHGARRLGSTGLYYLRNRVYSPELGRFLSRDPIGFAGGFNLYAYAAGNPASWRDPRGLDLSAPFRALVGAIGGGAIGAAQAWYEGKSNYRRRITEQAASGASFAVVAPYAGLYSTVGGVLRVVGLVGATQGVGETAGNALLGAERYAPQPDSYGIRPVGPLGGNPVEVVLPAGLYAAGDVCGKFLAQRRAASQAAADAAEARALAAAEELAVTDFRHGLDPSDTFAAYGQSGAVGKGVIATLDDGILNLVIEAGEGTPSGGAMFREAANAFGANVREIRGSWNGKGTLRANYDAYHAGLEAGMSPSEAAASTFTGKMARRLGFPRANVYYGPHNPGGAAVEVIFSK